MNSLRSDLSPLVPEAIEDSASVSRRCRTTPQHNTQSDWEPLLTPSEAAAFLRIHEKTTTRMARQRKLPAIRLGKHWRFRMKDLRRWAADQVQSTTPARRVMEIA